MATPKTPAGRKHGGRSTSPSPRSHPSSPQSSPTHRQRVWVERDAPRLPSSHFEESNWIRRDEHILPTPGSSLLLKDTWIDRGESMLPFNDGVDRLPRDTWIDKGVSLFSEDNWISRGETMLNEDNWITRGESLLPEDSWVSQGKKLIPNHERVGIDGLRELEEYSARQELESKSRSQTPRQPPTRLTNQELK